MGKTILQIHLDRLKNCKQVSDILVATSTNTADEIIFNKATTLGFKAFKGSEEDVLDRYYKAAKPLQPDWVVRVTSDCPLVDPQLVDAIILLAQKEELDYCSNTLLDQYPDGQDVEVFTFASLERAWKEANKPSEREHVTPFIKNNSNDFGLKIFKSENYDCESNYSAIRMTIDEIADFDLIEILVNTLGTDKSWKEYANYIIENGLYDLNKNIIRNEGYQKSLIKDKQS